MSAQIPTHDSRTDTETADPPRGGGLSQVLWYAEPTADVQTLARDVQQAREHIDRSEELMAYIEREEPEWIDQRKLRRVRR